MITTADGSPLVDSIIEDDGTHDTLVLGGRMHVDGVAHAAPTVTGDPTALAELDALQLGDLEPLLVGSGIADNLQFTKANVGARANATNCGSWMYTNQTVTCGSVFFGYTSMLLENFDDYPMMANFNGTATMLGGLGYGSSSACGTRTTVAGGGARTCRRRTGDTARPAGARPSTSGTARP